MKQNYLLTFGILVFLGLVFSSCSTEVGRVQIQEAGKFEESVALEGSPLTLWTDLDIEYIELTAMEYWIVFDYPDGTTKSLFCDPFDVTETRMERDAIVRGKTKISYLGKMACTVSLPSDEVTVTVDFDYQGKNVTVFRADLVFFDEE